MHISFRLPDDSPAALAIRQVLQNKGNVSAYVRRAVEHYETQKDTLDTLAAAFDRLARRYDQLEVIALAEPNRRGAAAAAELPEEVVNNITARASKGMSFD